MYKTGPKLSIKLLEKTDVLTNHYKGQNVLQEIGDITLSRKSSPFSSGFISLQYPAFPGLTSPCFHVMFDC
jgi:hypothetical protein